MMQVVGKLCVENCRDISVNPPSGCAALLSDRWETKNRERYVVCHTV